jgi:hypothetical protein
MLVSLNAGDEPLVVALRDGTAAVLVSISICAGPVRHRQAIVDSQAHPDLRCHRRVRQATCSAPLHDRAARAAASHTWLCGPPGFGTDRRRRACACHIRPA